MTPMSHHPIPFDPRIPALQQAVDGAIVGPLLREHLSASRSWAVHIDDCRIVRLRYRPETRCFVQYAVTLRDPCTGTSSQQVVTGALYADARRAARRARRLPGATFIPELSMLVSVFPSDRKLPQTQVLMAAADPEIRRAVVRSVGDGPWSVEAWRTEAVRYREELSLVVRYTVTARRVGTAEVRERTFYAKAYPAAGAARRSADYLGRLARYAAESNLGVRIAAPIACFDHLQTVVFTSTAGRPLDQILERGSASDAIGGVRESARALARFNLSYAPTVRHVSSAGYLESLRRPVMLLARVCPTLGRSLFRIVEVAGRGLGEVQPRPTHRDMKPEHVLLDPGGPALIDLDSCANADPVLDAGLMLARFAGLASATGRETDMRAFAHAFGEEYFARVPDSWRRRLPLYYATSLVEVAASLFHRQSPDWQARAVDLVRTASRVVAGSPVL